MKYRLLVQKEAKLRTKLDLNEEEAEALSDALSQVKNEIWDAKEAVLLEIEHEQN